MSALKQTMALNRRVTDKPAPEYRVGKPVLIACAHPGPIQADAWTVACTAQQAFTATLHSPWSLL